MRTLRFLAAGAVALTLLWACSDDEDEPVPGKGSTYDEAYYAEHATVSSEDDNFTDSDRGGEIAFKAEGGEVVLTIDCGVEWASTVDYLSGDAGWLVADANRSAGTLTVTADANTVEAVRSAAVTVMTATSSIRFAVISVLQNAYGACEIKVGTHKWAVPAYGDGLTTEITVEANAEWGITNTADWLTAEKTEVGVRLTAEESDTIEVRVAEVVLTCTDGVSTDSETITVTQEGQVACTITVSTNEWSAPAKGALTTEIAVDANADWEVEDTADWLTAEKTGTGLKLTASENEGTEERVAEVVLTCADEFSSVSETVTVTQDGKAYITIDAETQELAFEAEGGTETVEVESNFDVECSASEDWLTVSLSKGVLTVTASSNITDKDREGTVTLTAGDGAENVAEATVSVTQSGFDAGDGEVLVFGYTMTSSGQEAMLPLNGTVDCTVDWGDGNAETVTSTLPTHTYAEAGEYEVSVYGTVTQIASYVSSKAQSGVTSYLTSVKHWGNTGLTSMQNAFRSCSNLATLPEKTGDAFANVTSFSYAFYGCSKLDNLPSGLFANCPNVTSFSYAFYGCSKLNNLPSDLFANCPNATDFSFAFNSCINLTSLPSGLFANCPNVTTFANAFVGCSGLTSLPDGLFANCPDVTTFANAFYNCSKLSSLPNDLFKNNTKVTNLSSTFYGCTKLETIPAGLFDACKKTVTNVNSAFYGCSALKAVPDELFKGYTALTNVSSVFRGCTSLTSTGKAVFSGCVGLAQYGTYTFYGCTSLETIAGDLYEGCTEITTFANAFYGCTKLKEIPAGLFNDCTKVTTFTNTFSGCTSLTGESPYTEVGEVKVHLYERADYTEYFSKPSSTSGCFSSCTGLSDYSSIPSGWGGGGD